MLNHPNKRVVVLESGCLMYEGIKSFLNDQEHLDIIEIEAKIAEDVFQELLTIQPDVIILDQNNWHININVLMDLIRDLPMVRTVVVNVSNNQVKIFEQKQIVVQQLSDFLAVL